MQTLVKNTLKVLAPEGTLCAASRGISTVPSGFIRYKNEKGEIKFGEPIGTIINGCKVNVLSGDVFQSPIVTEVTETATEILYPIEATQIIGIGLNYRKHAQEAKLEVPLYPAVFIKMINSLNPPFADVKIPECCKAKDEVDFEGELAIIIKDRCKNVPESKVYDHILGYCIANDVSARRWQGKKGSNQWCRAKSFDHFTPLGPYVLYQSPSIDANQLMLRTYVNNQLMQETNTNDMIFNIPKLISFLSQDTTLLPGTVVLTGTPSGVGFARKPPIYLHDGDLVRIEIEKLGFMEHKIVN